MNKLSMTEDHLTEILAAVVCIGGVSISVEALRQEGTVMGVSCDEIVAAFDAWMNKVRAAVAAEVQGLNSTATDETGS